MIYQNIVSNVSLPHTPALGLLQVYVHLLSQIVTTLQKKDHNSFSFALFHLTLHFSHNKNPMTVSGGILVKQELEFRLIQECCVDAQPIRWYT